MAEFEIKRTPEEIRLVAEATVFELDNVKRREEVAMSSDWVKRGEIGSKRSDKRYLYEVGSAGYLSDHFKEVIERSLTVARLNGMQDILRWLNGRPASEVSMLMRSYQTCAMDNILLQDSAERRTDELLEEE